MRNRILVIVSLLILTACSKKNNGPKSVITPKPPLPGQAALGLPAQNAVCVSGNVISDSISAVTFTWSAAANADDYNLVLKNLLTAKIIIQSTISTQVSINLSRNTPYSWYVISRSTTTDSTAQSDTWRFYNAGPGIVTYAPFPAEITAPVFGAVVNAGAISLTWKGSSVNPGTIVNYKIYYGTDGTPPLFKATTDAFLNNVQASSGKTYYWRVITVDIQGNTSDSGVSQFTVN